VIVDGDIAKIRNDSKGRVTTIRLSNQLRS
jgi:hypothetical protein